MVGLFFCWWSISASFLFREVIQTVSATFKRILYCLFWTFFLIFPTEDSNVHSHQRNSLHVHLQNDTDFRNLPQWQEKNLKKCDKCRV